MKTKRTKQKTSSPRMVASTPIFDSTRSEIGEKIGAALDLMNDPRFKYESFVMTEEKGVRSYNIAASNEEMFISFRIDWKGGIK